MRIKREKKLLEKIKIIGVGGCGNNVISTMMSLKWDGVEFVSVNTDSQSLKTSPAPIKYQIGVELTGGLYAEGNPEIGKRAALESVNQISDLLKDADSVFITAGIGGGTGTGAAPVIAKIAKDKGLLTVAVITKPFSFEGKEKIAQAEEGIKDLRKYVNKLIEIPNDTLINMLSKQTLLSESLKVGNDIAKCYILIEIYQNHYIQF